MLNLKNYETIEKATENWNEASKIGVRANYRRLISYLSEQGKLVVNEGENITGATLEEINDFLIIHCGRIDSYQSITIRVNDFTKIFNDVLNIPTKFSNVPPNKIIKDNEGIYTKDEIVAICEQFINSQDKFLVYGIWYGLKDKKFDDITNIKVTDVDFSKNEIIVGNKIIEMDEVLREYCQSAIEEISYYKLGDIDGTSNEAYKLNVNSPYVVRSKPQRNNGMGLNRMTFNGLRTRIANLNDSLAGYGVLLKPQKLYIGGVIYKMHEETIANNTIWNNSTIRDFKRKHNISAFSMDTLLLYKNKYN